MGKYSDEFYRKRKNLMAKIARLNKGLVLDDNSPTPIELRVIIPNDIVPPKYTNVTKKDVKNLDKIIETLDDRIRIQADLSVRDDYDKGNKYLDPFTGKLVDEHDAYNNKYRATISYSDYLKYVRQSAYYKGQATKYAREEQLKERKKQYSDESFEALKTQIYETPSEVLGVEDFDWQGRVKELENIIASYNGKKQIDNTAKSNFSPPSEGEINRFKKYDDGIKKQQEYYAQANKQYTDDSHLEFTLTFDNVYSRLSEYEPQSYWGEWFNNVKREDTEKARNILNHAIVKIGIDNVARNIQANALEIDDLIDRIKYGSGGGEKYDTYRSEVKADLVKLQELLLGRKLSLTESIYWTEVSEEGESEY